VRRVLFLNGSRQRATVELHLQEGDSASDQRFVVVARPGSSQTRIVYPLISNVVEVRIRPMSQITLANGTVLHIRQPMHAPTGEEFDQAIVALEPAARGLVCGITDRGTVLTEEFV
jgi:hypothetical protein